LTLLGTLAEWNYPGSERHGGLSMSDGGNPLIPSVKCQGVMTTADPVKKVAAYYVGKFETPREGGPEDRQADPATAASVTVQDDSAGRPVAVRVVVVNRAETSTTQVISRAAGEERTHIAWSHYVRLGEER
jgi:hypothetical protein